MKIYDLIVIGGGSGGLVAAAGAAQLGARVALVEKKALGGDCLYTGCVPSKTLIRSARFAFDLQRAARFGFALNEGWQFAGGSFAAVTNRIARVIEAVGEQDAPARFRALGIDVIFGAPHFVSPHEIEIEINDNGAFITQTIRARRFCISTGSRPAVPPIEGLKEAGFITNEEAFRLKHLPRSLIVLGAGAIGLELAQAFARFGSRVTVVEMGARILLKEDEEVSASLEKILRAEGLDILLETKAVRIATSTDHSKRVTVERNGQQREITAEEILVATGRKPNTEGLNLERAGVRYTDKRIITDDYLRTTRSHIYAAGDVTGNFPFTHAAAYEAALVVRNALFFWPLTAKTDFRVVPWATFTDPEAARVGLTERAAQEHFGSRKVRVYRTEFRENDRAQAEEETRGLAKIICAGRREEIVGAHILGAHAGEIIQEIVLAMKQRLPASALGRLIHIYPTLTQVNQQAGLDAVLAQFARYRKPLSYYFSWRRSEKQMTKIL